MKHRYHQDLSSSTGKKKTKGLKDLGLPTLPDLREEFVRVCEEIGV